MVNYNESKEHNIASFPVRLSFCCRFASIVPLCAYLGLLDPQLRRAALSESLKVWALEAETKRPCLGKPSFFQDVH